MVLDCLNSVSFSRPRTYWMAASETMKLDAKLEAVILRQSVQLQMKVSTRSGPDVGWGKWGQLCLAMGNWGWGDGTGRDGQRITALRRSNMTPSPDRPSTTRRRGGCTASTDLLLLLLLPSRRFFFLLLVAVFRV